MEGKKRGIVSPTLLVVLTCTMVTMIHEVCATRLIVGVFVYDRNMMNVLEVNKTDYEACTADHPLHNWTTGAGRDVVPLNVTRQYYFISGKGFCYGGMKLAVLVEKAPPPPTLSPTTEKSGSSPVSNYRGQIVVPALLAIAAVWDAFIRFW
ncbi:hypothetical protein HHK36_030090 [Tetracentron sinense]|uniref:Phytocyanin domain-containing protein n=1 Tax=Tetracentron sinense TaxID=13715 RepID=A0A834YAT5_TETSI|nr:hypothetical protein HHK36_030090 [Tetracentron sinense]